MEGEGAYVATFRVHNTQITGPSEASLVWVSHLILYTVLV